MTSANWNHKAEKVDFYGERDSRSVFHTTLTACVRFEPLTDIEELHPGQSARILLDGEGIGLIGKVHPTVQKSIRLQRHIRLRVRWNHYLQLTQEAVIQSVAKYPSMTRDIAILHQLH